MIKPAVVLCDFCGKQLKESKPVRLPVITNCDWTEGKIEPPHIEFCKYDICEECLMKSTNIFADFQGTSPKFIDKRDQNSAPAVHAKWISRMFGTHECSNCHNDPSHFDGATGYVEILSDYCPNCGAKMDREDEEDGTVI